MWAMGTIVVLVVGAAITTAIGWTPRATASAPLWDILKKAGSFTGNAGTYAGFSLAVAALIARLDVARTAEAFVTTFGMMLVSFLILVVASWIAASPDTDSEAEGPSTQSLVFVLGNLCNNLGISITWLALAPLVALVGLSALADVFIWSSLLMVLAGSAWVAFVAYVLTRSSALACFAIPVVGIGLPAIYRLAAVRLWPALWPSSEAALRFAFVALAAAGLMFALYLGLLVAHANEEIRQRLERAGGRIGLGLSQVYVMIVALIWFALALP